jgi:hypothetical protein
MWIESRPRSQACASLQLHNQPLDAVSAAFQAKLSRFRRDSLPVIQSLRIYHLCTITFNFRRRNKLHALSFKLAATSFGTAT